MVQEGNLIQQVTAGPDSARIPQATTPATNNVSMSGSASTLSAGAAQFTPAAAAPPAAEHRAEIEKLRIGRGELPDDYYCSITCDVMKDPVMAADGYTYERVAIEQWLATGTGTSPKTNEVLRHRELTPNKALKTLIADELRKRAASSCGAAAPSPGAEGKP